jgi:phospholipase/carboxylesterase
MDAPQSSDTPRTEEEGMRLSVGQLRALLQARRVDYRDCIEKRDLVRRLLEAGTTSSSSTSTTASPSSASSSASPKSAAGGIHKYNRTYGGLDCVVVENSSTPDWIAIISHGLGANNRDLVPIAEEVLAYLRRSATTNQATVDVSDVPRIRFIHPNGHLPLEGGLPGGRMWWPVDMNALFQEFLAGTVHKKAPAGLEAARKHVSAVVKDALTEASVPTSHLILGGFSQGAILSLDVALHLDDTPAGVCIFSGVLLNEDEWKSLMPKKKTMRVLQCHGRADMLLPYFMGASLKTALQEAGVNVQFIEFDGGHTIPVEGLQAFLRFITDITRTQST